MENKYPLYTELAISEIIQTNYYTIFLRSDDIVQIHFADNFDCELEDAKQLVAGILKVCNNKPYPLLVIYGMFNTFSKEVNKYIASHNYTLADALVGDSIAFKIVGNFYMKINTPVRPTKLFVDVESAVEWLLQFKNKE